VSVLANKTALLSKKVCYRHDCAKTVSGIVVRHSLACLTVQKIADGDFPFYLNFFAKLTTSFKKGDFQSIFARGASTVTPSEISSIITNRKSNNGFSVSVR